MFYRTTLLALAFVVLPAVCSAEVITAYDLTGKAGNEFFDSATAAAANVNGEALLRGSGLTATTATNAFAASGWDDNSSRDYFTFSFFVAPGYQVTLTDLLIATRSSGTGPGALRMYYNYTGTLDLIRATFTQSPNTTLNSDIDLENLMVTGRATFTIFRDPFAGSASGGAVAPSGTFRIANYTDPVTAVVSPITFLGTVSRIGETGDFDGDGVVDAGDYVAWRKGLGTIYTQADYDAWRQSFGNAALASGSATPVLNIPEPKTAVTIVVAIMLVSTQRLQRVVAAKSQLGTLLRLPFSCAPGHAFSLIGEKSCAIRRSPSHSSPDTIRR